MAEDRVLNFLKQNNRPYNVQNVCDHLAQFGVKKSQVTKALDALAEANKITCKEFGKTKIYMPLQDARPPLSKEDMDAKQKIITELTEKVKETGETVRQLQTELQALQGALSAEELKAKGEQLQKQLADKQAKLAALKLGKNLITKERSNKVEKGFQRYMEAWSKRKRVFKEIWDAMSENMEGNDAGHFEEAGIVTDEAAGFSYKLYANLLRKQRRI